MVPLLQSPPCSGCGRSLLTCELTVSAIKPTFESATTAGPIDGNVRYS